MAARACVVLESPSISMIEALANDALAGRGLLQLAKKAVVALGDGPAQGGHEAARFVRCLAPHFQVGHADRGLPRGDESPFVVADPGQHIAHAAGPPALVMVTS